MLVGGFVETQVLFQKILLVSSLYSSESFESMPSNLRSNYIYLLFTSGRDPGKYFIQI